MLLTAAQSLLAAVAERCLALWCRYVKLTPADAEEQWQHQFEAAAQKSEKGSNAKGAWRVRELVLIGGLVLPIWGMVEQALVKQHRPTDRRMHVLRLQTTGGLVRLPFCPCANGKLCCTACCNASCTLRIRTHIDAELCSCTPFVPFCFALLCSVLFCPSVLCQHTQVMLCTVHFST